MRNLKANPVHIVEWKKTIYYFKHLNIVKLDYIKEFKDHSLYLNSLKKIQISLKSEIRYNFGEIIKWI